jgi:hypothetical protein
MPKKPEIESCANCRCFVVKPKDEEGLCKRLPPVVVVVNDEIRSVFPSMPREEKCGEYAVRLAS